MKSGAQRAELTDTCQTKGNLPAVLRSQPHGGGSTGASPSSIPVQLLIRQRCARLCLQLPILPEEAKGYC